MTRREAIICRILVLCLVLLAADAARAGEKNTNATIWRELSKGLELALFNSGVSSGPRPAEDIDSELTIVVLRIDPGCYELKLLAASELETEPLTLSGWVERFHLKAAINASMFWTDQETSTGFMRNFEHINQSLIHPEFGAFLVFNPKEPDLPEVQIVDRAEQPQWQSILEHYHTVIQNYRMIDKKGESVWPEEGKDFSVAAIGIDDSGRVLFILSQYPRTMHQLNQILLQLPIGLRSSLFTEGGPTAGLYVQTDSLTKGWHGISQSTLWTESPGTFAKVPNIIGIAPRNE
jgi:hypothetical protein